jgi:hypothetical protein
MSRQPNHSQLIGALVVIAVTVLAAVIVLVTRTTAGLVDLATLILAISSVLLSIAQGRKAKRRKH